MEQQTSGLAEFLREIERLAKASAMVEPKVIPLAQEKTGTYGIVTPGLPGKENKIEMRVAGPAWHKETLDDPKQLIGFIKSVGSRKKSFMIGADEYDDGVVYIGANQITYAFDFEDRRNAAVCPLKLSEPWKWLSVSQSPMDQRALIRLLRITFDGCLSRDSNLISVVRKVKWKSTGEVEADLQRGKEALGKQILNEAAGVADFPDEFLVTANVFENVNQPVTVRVALDLLPDVQKFEVIPFPNQIRSGLAETLAWLQKDIGETKVPTFIGSL
jgi:hypothetical protein